MRTNPLSVVYDRRVRVQRTLFSLRGEGRESKNVDLYSVDLTNYLCMSACNLFHESMVKNQRFFITIKAEHVRD